MRNERRKRHLAGRCGYYGAGAVQDSAFKSQGDRESDGTSKKVMGDVWYENAKDGDAASPE